ncbi:MAG: hypothetical protein ACTSVE_11575 [Candidatus Helarchaeota archaeon]
MLKTRREFDTSPNGVKTKAIANLLYYLVNIYALPKAKKKLKEKLDGKEILVEFPSINGLITFKIMGDRVVPYMGSSGNAVARFSLKVKESQLTEAIEYIIKSPGTNMGLLKLIFKYFLTGKAGFGGSLGATITFLKTIMIGNNEMYKISYD